MSCGLGSSSDYLDSGAILNLAVFESPLKVEIPARQLEVVRRAELEPFAISHETAQGALRLEPALFGGAVRQ